MALLDRDTVTVMGATVESALATKSLAAIAVALVTNPDPAAPAFRGVFGALFNSSQTQQG